MQHRSRLAGLALFVFAGCTSTSRTEKPPQSPEPTAEQRAAEAVSLLDAARADYRSKRFDSASTRAKRAADLFALSSDLRRASALQVIGAVHLEEKRYPQAIASFELAASIREKRLGPDDPLVALSLKAQALALHRSGEDDAAVAQYQRAYLMLSKTPSRLPERVGIALGMAAALRKRGDIRRAEAVLRDAMSAVENERGPRDRLYLDLLGPRDSALRALNENATADALWTGAQRAEVCAPEPCPPDDAPSRIDRSKQVPDEVVKAGSTGDVVGALRTAFHGCYKAGLARDPSAMGRIQVLIDVETDGSVWRSRGRELGYLDADTVKCVVDAAHAARFAPANTRTVVKLPLSFMPSANDDSKTDSILE